MKKSTFSRQDKAVNKKSPSGWKQVWQDLQAAVGITNRGTDKYKTSSVKKEEQNKLTSVRPSLKRKDPVENVAAKSSSITINKEDNQVEKASGKRKLLLPKLQLSKRTVFFLLVGTVVLTIILYFKDDLLAPYPPSPNVVASYDGGQITVEDVEKHLALLVPDEQARKEMQTLEGYRLIVEKLITDEVIRRFAKEKKTDQKKEISHIMQHITEEVNIDELHTQMHKGQMGVNESDIQAYYDANRTSFGEKTLTQVKDEIRKTLQSQQEDTFVQNYTEGLKNKASITRDTSLLAMPEPADYEIRNYFDTNRNKYEGKQFEEVASLVKDTVKAEKEKTYFKENADRTLFTVNGKRFTLGEFGQEYQELPVTFLTQYQGAEGKEQLVERIIERMLLNEDSLNKVSQTEINEKTDDMQLAVLGRILEQEEIDEKIKVTDEELKKYYDENKPTMVLPPQSKIRHIMIMPGQTDDEKTKAWQKANDAYKKIFPGPLQKGEDFAVVVREYSEDAETKDQGGEVKEWIGETPDIAGEMKEHEYHEQILALAKGDISKPFQAAGMIHIVQVLDRGQPRELSFDEVRDQIDILLKQQKHNELANELSHGLQKKVNTTIYERTLKTLVKN